MDYILKCKKSAKLTAMRKVLGNLNLTDLQEERQNSGLSNAYLF